MSLLLARLLGPFPLSNATLVVVLDTFKVGYTSLNSHIVIPYSNLSGMP
jgi:hypothetical protein